MATTHLWYTCCIDTASVPNWDVAVMPSYDGRVTSKMHGDTFAIMRSSQNPEAAFKVYTYMLGEGSEDLYAIYGGLPARTSQQDAFFAALDKKFAPNVVNWQVFLDGIPYLDIPNHEAYVPNYSKAMEAFQSLGSDLRLDDNLYLEARINQFVVDLNAIYAASGE
jgi:multiple sugar transport system substrate-binding protein